MNLDELATRKNQDFDGEAHLTNAELDWLISRAREAERLSGEVARLRTKWEDAHDRLAETLRILLEAGYRDEPSAAELLRLIRRAVAAADGAPNENELTRAEGGEP